MEIWKFRLECEPTIAVAMPEGAEVLYAREQGNDICVWAKVKPSAKPYPRTFEIRGTGWKLEGTEGRYLGSAHFNHTALPLVFHVFESTTANRPHAEIEGKG